MTRTRRLAAILAADAAGYSRLMAADEEATLETLQTLRRELLDPKIAEHHGRLVKTTGDGLLVEFSSVVDAIHCAVELQCGMLARNADVPVQQRMEFRIGINVGDVIVEGDDIYGDGVNIAARLEALAEPGRIVISKTARDQVRDRVPFALEDLGERRVKNIARTLHVYRVAVKQPGMPATTSTASVGSALALPDKPSIAVLPFANLSGDPEQEYFADGMVEEIITALSRIRWLFVIARNSSFAYRGQSVDRAQVGRELGVRYLLEGAVRKAGERVRITAQLIDAASGEHLWADRFDGRLEDVFELQDQVAVTVAGIIEPALQAAELNRSSERPTHDLTAYDLYLRALSGFLSYEREQIAHALDLLQQAIARDPRYGPALGLAANYLLHLEVNGWTEDPEADRRKAIDFARQALRVAADDPAVLVQAGFILAYFENDIAASIGLIDHSLRLNPSSAYAWLCSGWTRLWAGQPDLAIEHFEKSLRLNPRGRRATHLTGVGIAHLVSGRFETAAAVLAEALQQLPSFAWAYRSLASCYAHLGRLDEARAIVEQLRSITPTILPRVNHYRDPEHRERFLSGLRLAADEPS